MNFLYFKKDRIVIIYGAMKYFCFVLALIAISPLGMIFPFGCASPPSHFMKEEETVTHVSPTPPGEIRILTINVWSGLTYQGFFKVGEYPENREKRYRLLVTEIRKLDPDIIAVQEANPLPQYAKRLATDLDYRVIYHVALGGIRFGSFGIPTNMREGQAILVKKPWTIADLGRKRLSGRGIATDWFCFHFGEITQAFLGWTVVNEKPLYIYAVHLHSGPFKGLSLDAALQRLGREMPHEKVKEAIKGAEREIERRKREIANLRKFVDETLPKDMPAIILGDFNTTVESGELDSLLAGGAWGDSFRLKHPNQEGVTWDPTHNPNFRERLASSTPSDLLRIYHERHSYRIDLILVSSNIPRDHILESRIVLTPVDGFSVSDHYGVLTILKW